MNKYFTDYNYSVFLAHHIVEVGSRGCFQIEWLLLARKSMRNVCIILDELGANALFNCIPWSTRGRWPFLSIVRRI